MTSVTKVHLSVDTKIRLFLFFQIVTFSLGDSDRSDKRSQSQTQEGLWASDKRKPRVTKGSACRLRGLLSHRCFVSCSSVRPLCQGLWAFVTFVMSPEGNRWRWDAIPYLHYQENCNA